MEWHVRDVVIAAAGGALGILLSFAGVRMLVAGAPSSLPRLNEIHVNWPVLLVAAGLSAVTALLFGAYPAFRSMRVDPHSAMQTNRILNSREDERTGHLLVAGEVACTVVLLVITGLLIRSFDRVLTQQRDFDSSQVTVAQVDLYTPEYSGVADQSTASRAGFIDRAINDLRVLPAVESVAITSQMPLAGDIWVDAVSRPDRPASEGEPPLANVRWVSPGYLVTLKIPLVEGRNLDLSDKQHSNNALISASTAKTAWPGENPLGKKFFIAGDVPKTVVGVVADARINNLKNTVNMVYLPYWQQPSNRVFFLVRSSRSSASIASSIRRTIWNIDSRVAIPVLKSLNDQINDSVATERFQTRLLVSFGTAALLLAMLGVYGVLTYSVSLRQQEFGIRVALGSGRVALILLVLRQAMSPVLGGVMAGIVLAVGCMRFVGSLLYQTKSLDPVTVAVSVALLLLVAVPAALRPALHAARVDPIRVLRSE